MLFYVVISMRSFWHFTYVFTPRLTALLALCFLQITLFSQSTTCYMVFSDQKEPLVLFISKEVDSVFTKYRVEKELCQLKSEGYLDAHIDSVSFYTDSVVAYGKKGDLYRWVYLNICSETDLFNNNQGLGICKLQGKPIRIEDFTRAINSSLSFFENNGYPFARITFSGTNIVENQVNVEVDVYEGPKFFFDTLYIKGELKVSNRFLQSYLGCKQGATFSEKNAMSIDERLSLLPFVSLIRPSQVEFIPGKARVYTYLNKRNANRFSGIIGFGPRSNSSGGIMFTGNLNLKLINSLRNAETLSFQWNASGNLSQKLQVEANWPYLWGTNMAFDGYFSMIKRDTSFLTLNPIVSIGFHSSENAKFSLNYNLISSVKISEASDLALSSFRTNMLGFSYDFSSKPLRKRFSKGMEFGAAIAAGQRVVLNNEEDNRSAFIEIQALANVSYSLYKSIVLMRNGIRMAAKGVAYNENEIATLFDNELYRLGGSNMLRGFREESILTNQFVLMENELRFLFGKTFSIFSFFDFAVVSNHQSDEIPGDLLFGTGFGLSINTGGGALSVSSALGRGAGQPFILKNALIHVEYDSFF